MNLYGFVQNSPVNMIDRRGLIGFPGVSGSSEMQAIVSAQMAQKAAEACGKGEGTHSVSGSGHVTFNGPILGALLNISSWSLAANGQVSKDNNCSKCLKYSLSTTWNVTDSIDCNSFEELKGKGYFQPGNPWWGDLLGYIEGACEKIGLNIFAIPIDVKWQKNSDGCCN